MTWRSRKRLETAKIRLYFASALRDKASKKLSNIWQKHLEVKNKKSYFALAFQKRLARWKAELAPETVKDQQESKTKKIEQTLC